MRLFLKSSIRPLSDLSIHLVGFHCVLGSFVTGALQEPSYGHPYGRRHHTVHTVSHTAALKTVFSNPGCPRPISFRWLLLIMEICVINMSIPKSSLLRRMLGGFSQFLPPLVFIVPSPYRCFFLFIRYFIAPDFSCYLFGCSLCQLIKIFQKQSAVEQNPTSSLPTAYLLLWASSPSFNTLSDCFEL